MRTRSLYLKLMVCLCLIVQFVPGRAQEESQRSILPPAVPGLVPVHLPETREMEPEVREHITSSQNALAQAAKDAAATPASKLGEAYGMMGQIYQAYSLHSPARECYLNAAQLAPKDFRWVYLLGKLHEREGNAQAAINYYDAARKLREDYLPVFVSLGNIYLQLNRLDEAENFFRQALALNAESAATLYGLGQVALSKRSYQQAVGFLEKALRLAPEANRLHYALAMAYRGLKNLEKAQSHLSQSGTVGVRVSDPLLDGLQDLIRGARLHLVRGRTALEARRFSEAAAEFRKALKEQPDSITAHFNLGAALSQTGDLPGAIEQFKETLKLDPAHANAHYNLGLLLAQTNQTEQAITHLQTATKALPNDSQARILLARELVKVRRLEEAEAELSKVVELNPDDEDALLGRVQILLVRREYGRALEALEKGHAQFPQKGRTITTLAYLLAASPQLELRNGTRALTLARAVYEASASINHGVLVAMALSELGRCDEAAAWTRQLITRAEGDAAAAGLVAKLKTELSRYESARPCRPPTDLTFSDKTPAQ